VAASAQGLKDSTFECCWGLVENRVQSLRGSHNLQLRRDSSVVNTVGTDPGEARTRWSFGAGEIPKEEDRQLGIAVENREVPQTIISERSSEGFNP
jgi:hypothetical protein